MRIKYIRNVGFDFDIAQWIADSELVSDDDCQYFMRYRDLDCWRVMVKQEDFAPAEASKGLCGHYRHRFE